MKIEYIKAQAIFEFQERDKINTHIINVHAPDIKLQKEKNNFYLSSKSEQDTKIK